MSVPAELPAPTSYARRPLQSDTRRRSDAGRLAPKLCEDRRMTHVLFVCSLGRLRSPTAIEVFGRRPGFECKAAGIDEGSERPLSGELIDWAEIIFAMEQKHVAALLAKFCPALAGKRIVCLDIPDKYEYMAPALVRRLKRTVPSHLRELDQP